MSAGVRPQVPEPLQGTSAITISYFFPGRIGTGIVADPSLGGQGWVDYTVFPAVAGTFDMGAQVFTQIKAVLLTLVWSGVVSLVLFYVIKMVFGLRPSADDERQGLDQTSHGESAYNY